VGESTLLSDEQLRVLTVLGTTRIGREFYLAGGCAVAFHLGHRRSLDLDLFSLSPLVDLEGLVPTLVKGPLGAEVLSVTEGSMRLLVGTLPVDLVRSSHPPLEAPLPGPSGFPVAGLLDLASMKFMAVVHRGVRRDFWDLHEMLQSRSFDLDTALDAYVARFGKQQSDPYAVLRALTYFKDAEKESVLPNGLSEAHWQTLRRFFRSEAPKALMKRLEAP
jgi:hypothetical protein